MDVSTRAEHLTLSQKQCLQDLLGRYEAAWQGQTNPLQTMDLSDYLPFPGDALRPVALQELVQQDLLLRWKNGQKVTLDYYLNRYPELGGPARLPPQLIAQEYRVRKDHGDNPTLDLYQTRFPGQFAEVSRLVESQRNSGRGGHSSSTPTPSLPAAATESSAPVSFERGMDVGNGYSLIERIGTGGYGEVWRATSRGGIEVAIKISFQTQEQEDCARELQSLELVKQLRHPYLLQTHAFWIHRGRLHIAMELADGNLRARLRQCRKQGQPGIPATELIRYFRQVAEALDFLHARSILHRDIKPDNILLIEGYAKVADFGLARQMLTQHSMAVSGSGTPAYMAPEMFASKVSAQTDQYCLAVTYAELRLDRRLFPGQNLMELMMQHVSTTPRLDPLPPGEQEALLKALEKKPADRYPNCQDFVWALEQVLLREGTTLPTTGPRTVPTSISAPTPPSRPVASPRPAPPAPPPAEGLRKTEPDLEKVPTQASEPDYSPTLPSAGARAPAPPPPAKPTQEMAKPSWKKTALPAAAKTATEAPARRKVPVLLLAVAAVVVLAGGGFLVMSLLSKKGGETPAPDNPVVKHVEDKKEEKGGNTPDKSIKPPVEKVNPEAQKTLDQGFLSLAKQDLAGARDLFQKVADGNGGGLHRQALLGLAQVHARQNDWDQVRQDLQAIGPAALPKSEQEANRQALKALAFPGSPKEKLQLLAAAKLQPHADDLSSWERAQLDARLNQAVEAQIPQLQKPDDFRDLLPVCKAALRTAQPSRLVRALKAECLLAEPLTPAVLNQARTAVDGLPAEATGYVTYVQGRLRAAEGKVKEAAQAMTLAFPNEKASQAWQNAARRQKAAAICHAAGKAEPPASAAAFSWLQRAVKLHPAPPADWRLELAEAARTRTPTPDWNCVKEQTEALSKDPDILAREEKAYTVRLWHAQSQENLGEKEQALGEYRDLFVAYQQKAQKKSAYTDALEHGIQVGQGWAKAGGSKALRKNLALLFAAKGRFLWDNPQDDAVPVPPGQRVREAADAYGEAGAYYLGQDRDLATFLAWRGYLLTQLPPVDPAKLQDLAQKARKAAPNFSGVKFLDGLAEYYRAIDSLAISKQALVHAQPALSSLIEALRLGRDENPPSELLGPNLAVGSAANGLVANLLLMEGSPRPQILPYLEQGLGNAQELVKLDTRHPWQALLVRGAAQEQLAAWGHRLSAFDEAFKDYTQAIQIAPKDEPAGWIARARAHFRYYSYDKYHNHGKGLTDQLAAAEQDGQKGYDLARGRKDRALQAAAAIWLGRALLAKGEKEPKAFDRALPLLEEGIKGAPPALRDQALLGVQEELSLASQLAGQKKKETRDLGLRLFRAVRKQCELFAGKGDWEDRAAWVEAMGSDYEGGWEQSYKESAKARAAFQAAKRVCDRTLKKATLADDTRVELLVLRSKIFLADADEREDLARDNPQCIQDADKAVALAKKAYLRPSLRAAAYFQAGKARYYKVSDKSGEWSAKKKRAEELKGVDYIETALKLDPENAGAWEWHYYAGGLLSLLGYDTDLDKNDRKDYLKRSQEYFQKVVDDKKAASWATEKAGTALDTLKKQLEKSDEDK